MITFLQGEVATIYDGALVLNVHGVGFLVQIAHPEFFQKGTQVSLLIHLLWSQEQGPALFGFSHEQEKMIFQMVVDCSGFGPRIALLLVKKLSPTDFLRAIQMADMKVFSGISGIGPKKAEQLIVQLKHKVTALIDQGSFDLPNENMNAIEQWKNISQALQSLNYSRLEIDKALSFIVAEGGDGASFDILLRKALQFLAKK